MNNFTSVSITNRTIKPFTTIIEAIASNQYDLATQILQKKLRDFYERLYRKNYQDSLVEYHVREDAAFWVESLVFKESCHSNNFLSISLDTVLVDNPQKIQLHQHSQRMQYRIHDHFSDDEFSHVLLRHEVMDFANEVVVLLSQTHRFEISAEDGVLIFKAIPLKGTGTLCIVSRSQHAVMTADIAVGEQLRQMGYSPTVQLVSMH